ncbi:unnamed protein product [Auanema sp. JU1783]|nr:unnamed protein product [Auanema sp. JU1783]
MASELRELLANSQISDKYAEIDIKDDFFKDCEGLALGEVALMDGFRLNDAMSAVELMDPKMDIGMERYIRKSGVDQLKSIDYFNTVNDREVLTIVDATMACLVSYLEGGNVANTLYSNVLLSEPYSFYHPVLSTLAETFSYLISMIRIILHDAMVFEEEDFNGSIPYVVPCENMIDEQLSKLKSFEDVLGAKSTSPASEAIVLRFTWLRSLMEYFLLIIPQVRTKEQGLSSKITKPSLPEAIAKAEVLKSTSNAFKETWKLGLEAPSSLNGDSKFEWLGVFQPDYNKQYLTGSFPRKTRIVSRDESMNYLYLLSCRLHRIAADSAEAAADFSDMLKFLKDFSMDNSCVLSRSVLQLTLFPHDELVLGSVSLPNLIDSSVRKIVRHLVLEEGNPVSQDEECVALYGDFLDDMAKASLTMIANFGMNLARQREKLSASIDELIVAQSTAEHLDRRCNSLLHGLDLEGHPQNPLLSFVFNHLINIINYHLELSFKLDLFAPYEYSHFYWYYGEILCRWHLNSIERILEVTYYDYKMEVEKVRAKNKKKSSRQAELEENLKTKMEQQHCKKIKVIGEAALANGISRATAGLTKWGKIKVPRWEPKTDRIHFEHRMAPFARLGLPLHLSYDQYLNISKYNELLEKDHGELFKQAIDLFEMAKAHFHRLIEASTLSREAESLEKLCKNNIVVLRLLSSGKVDNKKADWVMSDDSIFPILRLS